MSKKFIDLEGLKAYHEKILQALKLKPNSKDVYTKNEADSKLDEKANVADIYDKTEIDSKLNEKANVDDVYTKTEVDTKLEDKADKAIVNSLGEKVTTVELDVMDKADKTDVYTKDEVEQKLSTKASISNVTSLGQQVSGLQTTVSGLQTTVQTLGTQKANAADVYTKSEVDSKLANAGGGGTVSGDYLPLSGGEINGEVIFNAGNGFETHIDGSYISNKFDGDGYWNEFYMCAEEGNFTASSNNGDSVNLNSQSININSDNASLTVGWGEEVVIDTGGIKTPAITITNGAIITHTDDRENGFLCPDVAGGYSGYRFGQMGEPYIANCGETIYFPSKSGTIALTSDIPIVPTVPTYYMHTISISKVGSTTCNMTFMVMSKSSTAFTASTLYSKYPSKAFACSGYYGTNIVSKIAFTGSNSMRVVYGSGSSTATVSTITLSDTVIEVV